MTVRNERNVIPVKAEYRQDFNGIVHDQSASGQTLYIEPASVVELNNQVSRLRSEEATERQRILAQLTQEVAEEADACLLSEKVMGHLDFWLVKRDMPLKSKELNQNFLKSDKSICRKHFIHSWIVKRLWRIQ